MFGTKQSPASRMTVVAVVMLAAVVAYNIAVGVYVVTQWMPA